MILYTIAMLDIGDQRIDNCCRERYSMDARPLMLEDPRFAVTGPFKGMI